MSIQNTNSGVQQKIYSPHLSDLFHIRQLERLLKNALTEIEQLKNRVTCLEKEMAIHKSIQTDVEHSSDLEQSENAPPAISIPIAEMKQLAEMAKRFR